MKLKQTTFATLALFIAFNAAASETLVTRIHDVIAPESGETSYRIFSTVDGRVYDLNAIRAESVREVEWAKETGTPLTLVIENDEVLEASTSTEKDLSALEEDVDGIHSLWTADRLNASYAPTRLNSWAEATELFEQLEWVRPKSQCYQRAMLWTHQMYSDRGIHSMKVFLFFTRKYIREYNYKWWFHVTPYVLVGDEEATLDRTFTDGPMKMHPWTNEFMEGAPLCPTVETYDGYANHQEEAYCYLRKVPMYYYQPVHIEEADRTGVPITNFRSGDLAHARRGRCGLFCF